METHHQSLVLFYTLSKPKRQIANSLSAALNPDRLVVCERVVLARHPGVVDHRPGICRETRHGAPDVRVDLHNLLYRRGFEQLGRHALLDSKDDAEGRADADRRRSELRGRAMGQRGGEEARGQLLWVVQCT